MTTRLNVLIVHGIGTGENGTAYARPLEDGIRRAFDRTIRSLKLKDVDRADARAKNALRLRPVDWAPITQRPQDAMLKLLFGRFRPFARLNLMYQVRRSMVALAGDVIAYERTSENPVYREIHAALERGVIELGAASADEPHAGHAPLTIVGHSLGSVIVSDYVWDHTQGESHHLSDHGLSLVNMILMGSPMILYALRRNAGGGIDSIREALDCPVKIDPDHGLWLNLYDRSDPIAFPLGKVESYRAAGVIDREVSAGNWLTSRTMLSHTGYWQSDDVAQHIARKLALDWARLNSPRFAEEKYDKALADLRRDLRD